MSQLNSPGTPGARIADVNPYAPPAAAPTGDDPRYRRVAGRSTGWAIAYYVAAGVALAFYAMCQLANDNPAVLLPAVFGALASSVVGVIWLGKAWNELPILRQQVGHAGVTSGGIIGRMFIPFYNIYWMFAAPRALTSGLEDELNARGHEFSPLVGLATTASAAQFVGQGIGRVSASTGLALVIFAVNAGLWGTLVVNVERRLAVLRRDR